MNTREHIGRAALCAAAGLWICASLAGAEEAREDSSVRSVNIWPQPAEMARSADYAVSVGGTARPAVYVESHDTRHIISGFRFENVTECGVPRRVDRDLKSPR